jgi:hypothetical protein
MTALDRQILTLAAKPDLVPECRALILAAGALQAGKISLVGALDILEQPGFPGLNLPREEGARLGLHIAANVGEVPGACAFRAGTIPNQSLVTLDDATDCVASGDPFLCHQDGQTCRGWIQATQMISNV